MLFFYGAMAGVEVVPGKGFYAWSDPRNPKPRDLSQYVLKSTDDYLSCVK